MTGFIPKKKLTAYQRWEVAAFDEAEQAARAATAAQKKTAPDHDATEGDDQLRAPGSGKGTQKETKKTHGKRIQGIMFAG